MYQRVKAGVPFFEKSGAGMSHLSPITLDDELGWRATEQYREDAIVKTARGKTYEISRSQDEHGFRMFGDVHSQKMKILAIGDSFTQAVHASDGKPYYAVLKKTLDAEVFAYGAGGYGTLQEYMILDRYVDLIKPDLVLWEYCSNDFINNEPALERASRFNNNGMRRPYWIDGKIQMILPAGSWERTREFANRHSRFMYFLLSRMDRLRARFASDSVETDIERQLFDHPGFRHAIQITDELMGRVRARAGAIPILAFSCDGRSPYTEAFQSISTHHDIRFLNAGTMVREAKDRGEDVLDEDQGHWNEDGHRLVGELFAGYIKATPMLFARHSIARHEPPHSDSMTSE
ncbi:MAG TPA: SGNH/GDSL hydrolase family protein [Nitrospiraceae bacterium]|nr:SGNH/GDSL hydrolase family protein [Nitrospiraceae bacterium]